MQVSSLTFNERWLSVVSRCFSEGWFTLNYWQSSGKSVEKRKTTQSQKICPILMHLPLIHRAKGKIQVCKQPHQTQYQASNSYKPQLLFRDSHRGSCSQAEMPPINPLRDHSLCPAGENFWSFSLSNIATFSTASQPLWAQFHVYYTHHVMFHMKHSLLVCSA